MPRVAVVDIGTNSTRLLIADVQDGRIVSELERRSTVTRLGEGVDQNHSLQPQAIERVVSTLDEYAKLIERHRPDKRIAVLTSAVRDAVNGREFAATINQRYRLEAHILTGDEEARLTFLGATSERDPDDQARTLVVDIGGGSTELIIGAGRAPTFHVSTQAGVVRQSERHIHHDPPTRQELDELANDVRDIISGSVPADQRAGVEHAIAVAGTPTSLAAIDQELEPYDPTRVHGYILTKADVDRLTAFLAQLTLEQRKALKGLDPARAPTIVAGAVILSTILDIFGLEAVEVSEHDILRGAALGDLRAGLC
jgi:exopolyphosphatase/guanosine-5'-triphosphate,3'-diphosphate pyrophosphatase